MINGSSTCRRSTHAPDNDGVLELKTLGHGHLHLAKEAWNRLALVHCLITQSTLWEMTLCAWAVLVKGEGQRLVSWPFWWLLPRHGDDHTTLRRRDAKQTRESR